MGQRIARAEFLADLRARIDDHCAVVQRVFASLDKVHANAAPKADEWSPLQCFDHLNLTHDYYRMRIGSALDAPKYATPTADVYAPSFWGRIYMRFALNPRYSFPVVSELAPQTTLERDVLAVFLMKQQALLQLMLDVQGVDLRKTPVPLEKGVRFNLGDCMKVLVYHDELHIDQALRAAASVQQVSGG